MHIKVGIIQLILNTFNALKLFYNATVFSVNA